MLRKLIVFLSMVFYSLFFLASYGATTVPISADLAVEKILNFSTNIIVNKDATLNVTEKITAYANQNLIKYGIVRIMRTNFVDDFGVKHRMKYQIASVLMNGHSVPYTVTNTKDQTIINIGDPGSLLAPGAYIFTIKYRVDDAINFFKKQDVFFWNITGNNWNVPILNAVGSIHLPKGVEILNITGFTGLPQQSEQNFSVAQPTDYDIVFQTRQPLKAKESFTVGISWPKGLIRPEEAKKGIVPPQISKHPMKYIGLLVVIVLMGGYLVFNYARGRRRRGMVGASVSDGGEKVQSGEST